MNTRLITLLFLGLLALPALAVIDVKMPLGKMYVDSKAIAAGEITKIADKTIEIKLTTQFKGKAAETITIQVKAPATLLTDLSAENATKLVAILDGARIAPIHIADKWYLATSTRPGFYVINALGKADLDKAYTGTTENLIKELTKLQAQDTAPPASPPSAK